MDRPVIAIMYDFDKTLCTKDMQDYGFIPSLELQPSEFWDKANTFGSKAEMDGVLAYLYTMIGECRRRGIALTRESLIENGRGIVLYDGVREWFDRINLYGAAQGVQIEHYVISSGLKEIIEGSGIADKFTKIFACEFLYDEDGAALWPKTAVNYTNFNGTGGASAYGEEFDLEISDYLTNIEGSVAMANRGPGTNGSQFYINQINNNYLDGNYTVFGQVYEGMDIVNAIAGVKTGANDKPLKDVILESAELHEYEG